MKYLVFSDSHGRNSYMEDILEKEKADGFIHLGDGIADAERLTVLYPQMAFIGVSGNCDSFFSPIPDDVEKTVTVEGVPLMICHGHRYGVKLGTDRILYGAKEKGAKAVLFGHTHRQLLKKIGGILLLNPGSVGERGEYAVLELAGGKASAELRRID